MMSFTKFWWRVSKDNMVKNGCRCPFSVLNEKKAFHVYMSSSFHVGATTWQWSLNFVNFVTLLIIQVVHIQPLLISIVGVCYHEDLCTKYKCMFRIPMLGLFWTCRENSFLFEHTNGLKHERIYLLIKKQKPTYLGRKSFFHSSACPILSGSLLKANALHPLHFPSPHATCSLPAYRAFIFTYKDYINKPDSSVGHSWKGCYSTDSRMSMQISRFHDLFISHTTSYWNIARVFFLHLQLKWLTFKTSVCIPTNLFIQIS